MHPSSSKWPIGQLRGPEAGAITAPSRKRQSGSRMAQGKLEITVGGIADMATPMRVDENLSRGVYEGFFMCKLTVAGGSPHYLKLRVVGSDDFDNEGEVPVGWG